MFPMKGQGILVRYGLQREIIMDGEINTSYDSVDEPDIKSAHHVHAYQIAYPDRVRILKEHARMNRSAQTDAEKVLWEYLRRNALGVRFRRQFIIGDFIVDFACIEKKLVVEVDGEYHFSSEQVEEDRKRSYHISQLGYRVIRFTNEEVMIDINNVILNIKKNLYEQ